MTPQPRHGAEPISPSRPLTEDLIRSFLIAAAAVLGFIIIKSGLQFLDKDYDFHVYYGAGLAYNTGMDPYLQANIRRMDPAAYMPFIYPPYMLPFFGLVARLQYDWAVRVVFFIQFLALWSVVAVWRRYFIGPGRDTVVTGLLFAGLAFSGWCTWVSGNISYIEHAFLWLAFACFVRERYHLFGVFMLIAGITKLVPLVFLVLFLATRHERKGMLFLGYAGVAVVWLGAWQLMSPVYVEKWLTNALAANNEGGFANPSSLMLFFDTARFLGVKWLYGPMYVAWSVFVLVLTVKVIRTRLTLDPKALTAIVLFAVVAFCLIAPRLKSYALIMVIPSLVGFSYDIRSFRLPVWVLAILPMAGTIQSKIPLLSQIAEILSYYWPQVVLVVVWLAGLKVLGRPSATDGSETLIHSHL